MKPLSPRLAALLSVRVLGVGVGVCVCVCVGGWGCVGRLCVCVCCVCVVCVCCVRQIDTYRKREKEGEKVWVRENL